MRGVRLLGVDLAWGNRNESGVVALDPSGSILDAGWTVGLEATAAWVFKWQVPDTLLFVDAPLLVMNATGQRLCEREVGQRYGRWKVSANSTNTASPRLAGVALRVVLERQGWRYDDGTNGPPANGLVLSECYPYTTLVGADALGYDQERPRYKRAPRGMGSAVFAPQRSATCDDLIDRIARLITAEPPMDLGSHPVTNSLLVEPSPVQRSDYKHREDLIDAALCAWTASLWTCQGEQACQVLGADDPARDAKGRRATIIAPARPDQRPP
jgi:predicted RNase H-like nuclease